MNELNEKLVADLKTVSADVQQVLQATAGDARQEMASARERLRQSAERINGKLADLEARAVARTKAAVADGDRYVRDHPWQVVGIAGALGFVLGLALKRRD
jgi:ElaB/YqjD/DUF883 family membrane-anchored ribosome-binding protein